MVNEGPRPAGMPIRFYCPFCEQLLGITSQKVGTVVECPKCHGRVGVPSPDAPPPLFPVPAPTSEIILGPGQILGFGCGLVFLAGLAFCAGLLVGALG
jgi:hypothetical protein